MLTSRPARVFLQLAAFAAGWILVQGIMESFAGPVFGWMSRAVGEPVPVYPWAMLAGVAGGCWIGFYVVETPAARGERRASIPERLGVGAETWRARPLLLGTLLGTAAIGLTALLLFAAGFLRFEWASPIADAMSGDSWGAVALRLFVLLAPAALWEELAFRGFLYTVAAEAAGVQVARWSSSVAFGVVHIMNPGASLRTTLIVMLAGWCLARLREHAGVPAAWLAHLAWNWIMAAVLHVAVSGLPFATPGYRAVLAGPEWLTGGSWGPEGGLVAACVLGGGAWLGWRGTRRGGDGRITSGTTSSAFVRS